MHASEVIETYIDDTVRLLRRRQRDDVATELRSLLNEELKALAQESGRSADESLALSLVRGFGTPREVAARYQPPWAIIDPVDSTSFMRAAIIGAGVLIVLSALGGREPSLLGVEIGIFAWLGLLVVVFGARNWVRRRWPNRAIWKPRDRDRANRIGTAVAVPIAALCVVLYAAPSWVLDHVSRGRLDTTWATYTEEFQRFRLPWFIGLLVGLLALRSFVAIHGRWSWLTRRINIGLNLALAGLTLSLAVEGNIFQSSVVDQIARSVLALVAVIYVTGVGIMLYDEIGRVDRTVTATEA
jgi:hypothetical protein